MKLQELGMGAEGLSREESSVFYDKSRAICASYYRALRDNPSQPLGSNNCWKVLVNNNLNATRPVYEALGIVWSNLPFAYNAWSQADTPEQKMLLLDYLHEGLARAAAHYDWNPASLVVAREAVIASNFEDRFNWPKAPRWSRNRRYRAQLQCTHGFENFSATLLVLSRSGDIAIRHAAFTTRPREHFFVPQLGKLTWQGKTVALTSRTGEIVCSTEVPG